MNEDDGSHCEVLSERPIQLNMSLTSLRTCLLHLSFQKLGWAVPKRSHMHAEHFSVRRKLQQHSKQDCHTEQLEVRCLRRMCSSRLCGSACALTLTHMLLNTLCVHFLFSSAEGAQGVGFVCAPASTDIPSSSPLSSITSLHLDKFCETKCVNFVTFAILQIVSVTFVNHES